MRNLTDEDRFLDFRTRIRNADSHSDAEEVLEALTPANIRRLANAVAKEHGKNVRGGCWVFEDFGLYVLWDSKAGDTVIRRTTVDSSEDWIGVVFSQVDDKITVFEPLRVWNILNYLEEILETGEISI